MPATITQTSKPLHPRALDTSGNNNHGTAYTGQALEFDGVGDYIDIGSTLEDWVEQENKTMSVWLYNAGNTSEARVFNIGKTGTDTAFALGIDGGSLGGSMASVDNQAFIFLRESNGTAIKLAFGDAMATSTWYHFAIVQDGSNDKAYLYMNGVLEATIGASEDAPYNQAVGEISQSTSTTAKIGAAWYDAAQSLFNGALSNLQLWDKAWTASDVAYAYLNPEKLALDNPGTSLTYSDLKLWYPMQGGHRGNQSFLLDGSNTGLGDEVITNGDFATGDLTGWTISDTWDGTDDDGIIFENGGARIRSEGDGVNMYQAGVLISGVTYKIVVDMTYVSGRFYFRAGNQYALGITGSGTHTHYLTADTDRFWISRDSTGSHDATITNVSVKPVNAKNHGTSVFYGDELYTTSNAASLLNEADATTGFSNVNADTFASQTSVKHTGSARSLHISEEGGTATNGARAYQDLDALSLVDGRTYLLSFYARHVGSGGAWQISHGISGSSSSGGVIQALTSSENTFVEYTSTFVHSADTQYLVIQENSGDNDGGVYIDQISIKEVGFATGWTEADAQPTIPQLGFQSYNQLAWFDGTADYVDLGISANADLGLTTSFTVSCWAIASNSTIGYIWNFYQDTSNGIGVKMHKTVIQIYDDMTANDAAIYNTAITGDVWHHIVLSVDDSDMTLYVDGVSIGTGTDMTESLDQATYDLYIGSRRADANAAFAGAVTECSIFNSALTLAKVQELYNDGEALDATLHSSVANLVGYWRNRGTGTWTDLSTNSNNGTPTSISEHLILPEGQNNRDTQGFLMTRDRVGVNLDGVSAFVGDLGMGDAYGDDAMSIGCWFKCEDVSSSTIQFIWGEGHYSLPNKYGFGLGILSSNLRGTAGNNATAVWDNLNYSISSDTWYHAVLVYDKDNGDTNDHFYRLYVDGVLRDSYDTDNTPRFSDTHESYLIGCSGDHDTSPNYGSFFKGSIDDVTLYSTALTANQVARNYKAGKRRHKN